MTGEAPPPDEPLDDEVQAALDALSDDEPFDWDALDDSPSPSRETLRQLRIVAGLIGAHRPPDDTRSHALPAPPFQWQGLRVHDVIGRGTSGAVYRAYDAHLDRWVALKLLPQDGVATSARATSAVHEGRLLARVRHPHVVTVHGADVADGVVGIWMELVDGVTLDRIVAETGPLPVDRVVSIGIDLCGALAAVHEADLLHCDVKAQNVVSTQAGRVVLMDFGAGHDVRGVLTRRTGTPMYLAPEVLRGGPPTVQSDLYALGVLLHLLLTGRYPIEAETVEDLAAAHVAAAGSRVRDVDAAPRELAAVLERALAAEPGRRFPSASSMGLALADISAARRQTRRRAGTPLLVALAAGVLGANAWLAASRLPDPQVGAISPGSNGPSLRRMDLPDVFLPGRPSRDGAWLTYTSRDGNLMLLDLDRNRPQALTSDAVMGPDGAQFADFSSPSPDGRRVAYGWTRPGQPYQLRLADRSGRATRVLLERQDVSGAMPFEWWGDGQSLLVALRHEPRQVTLARLFVASGRLVPLAATDGPMPEHASPSPDGRWVAFDRSGRKTHDRDIVIVSSDGTSTHALLDGPANDFAPTWSPDGRRLLFLSDRSGAVDLWAIPLAGRLAAGLPELTMRNVGRTRILGLTSGGRLLHQRLTGAVDVYVADLASPVPTPLTETFVGTNLSPRWSPDGSRIAYVSRRGLRGLQGDHEVLVVRDLRGASTLELTPPIHGFVVADWSPDGRRLLLHGFDTDGVLGLHQLDLTTGRTEMVVRSTGDEPVGPGQWRSNDSIVFVDHARRALLSHGLAGGRDEVLLDFAAAGVEGLVGGPTGRGFVLSSDGRRLAYSAGVSAGGLRATVLRVRTLSTGETRELARVSAPTALVLQDWVRDGSALLVTKRLTKPSQPPSLWRLSLVTGEMVPIGLSLAGLRDISVDPDGKRVTFTSGAATFDTWVMDGLTAR
jgi:serine/threonine protein kinase/Tol biopolymer transport system component